MVVVGRGRGGIEPRDVKLVRVGKLQICCRTVELPQDLARQRRLGELARVAGPLPRHAAPDFDVHMVQELLPALDGDADPVRFPRAQRPSGVEERPVGAVRRPAHEAVAVRA